MLGNTTKVENSCLGRHVAVNDTKLLGARRPADIMNRTFFVCANVSMVFKGKKTKMDSITTNLVAHGNQIDRWN